MVAARGTLGLHARKRSQNDTTSREPKKGKFQNARGGASMGSLHCLGVGSPKQCHFWGIDGLGYLSWSKTSSSRKVAFLWRTQRVIPSPNSAEIDSMQNEKLFGELVKVSRMSLVRPLSQTYISLKSFRSSMLSNSQMHVGIIL